MRTIAYNVYGCTGWPEAAVAETWTPERGAVVDRMIEALDATDPALLTIAEAPPTGVVEAIARGLDMEARTFPSREDWPGALLADVAIREADDVPELLAQPPADLFTRHAGRTVVAADDREFVVYSLHLHPSEEATRLSEIEHLRDVLEEDIRSERPVVVQGDLNHEPDGPEYEAWQDLGLTDVHAAVGEDEPTHHSDDPSVRIDYVWVSDDLAAHLVSADTMYERPFGPGIDRSHPDGPFLSDHLPVVAEFDAPGW